MNIFSRLFKKQPENKDPLPILGDKLRAFDSMIYSGANNFEYYNPDDLLIKKGNEVYEAMLNDDQVKAVIAFKKAAVISRGYSFDKEVGNKEHEKIEAFFLEVIEQMNGSFSSKIKSMLSAYTNGFFIGELLWDNIEFEGKTYWSVKDIKKKPFSTFLFKVDQYGEIIDLVQVDGAKEVSVPIDKVIHFVYQPEENLYYGKSDLRACYRAWWSKDIVIRFQNIHIERHASGLPVVMAEEGADVKQKSKIINMLKNISIRTGFYLPRGYKMEIHSPQTTDTYERAVAQHDKAIAKSVLVPNLLGITEQGNTGSYAQSQTQLDAFIWVIDADTADLEETLNEQLWKRLAEVNFGTSDYPKMRMGELTAYQKEALAKLWNELVKGKAVTNTNEDEAYTRQLLGYPEKPEDLEEEESEEDNPPIDEDLLPEGINPEDPFLMAEFAEKTWLRRVNFRSIEKTFNVNEKDFVLELNTILGRVRLSIDKQIVKIAGDRSFGNIDLKEFNNVQVPKGELSNISKAIRGNLQKTFQSNYSIAKKELPKKQFKNVVGLDKTRADKFLSQKALKIKDIMNADILKSVQNVLAQGIKYDESMQKVINRMDTDTKVREYLPEVDSLGRTVNVAARLENIARTNTAEAVNQARMSLFGDPSLKGFVRAYEYSAAMDGRTTDICSTLHGQVKRNWDNYLPPNHYQCRSILVPVTQVDDWDEKEYRIPTRVQPHQGFG